MRISSQSERGTGTSRSRDRPAWVLKCLGGPPQIFIKENIPNIFIAFLDVSDKYKRSFFFVFFFFYGKKKVKQKIK